LFRDKKHFSGVSALVPRRPLAPLRDGSSATDAHGTGTAVGVLCVALLLSRCTRQTDVRQKHRLMSPPYAGGGIAGIATVRIGPGQIGLARRPYVLQCCKGLISVGHCDSSTCQTECRNGAEAVDLGASLEVPEYGAQLLLGCQQL